MFDRARSSGGIVFLAGVVGRGADGDVVRGGVMAQLRAALERIEQVLAEVGRDRTDLLRLRVYLTDVDDWPQVKEDLLAFFDGTVPPCTVLAVAGLVEPTMLVEIEAEART